MQIEPAFLELGVQVALSHVEDGLDGAREWPPPQGSGYEHFLEHGIESQLASLEPTILWWRREQQQVARLRTNAWTWFEQHISDLEHLLARREELRRLPLTTRTLEVAYILTFHGRDPVPRLPPEASSAEEEAWMQDALIALNELNLLLAANTWGLDAVLPRALPPRTSTRPAMWMSADDLTQRAIAKQKPSNVRSDVSDPSSEILDNWTGDVDELVGLEDELDGDFELCQRLFSDKAEAFSTGLWLGRATASAQPQGTTNDDGGETSP